MYQRLFKEVKDPMMFLGLGMENLPEDSRITTHGPTWDIQDFYPPAKWVAGLFKGRTQYEAWAMDREFRGYDWEGNRVESDPPDNFRELFSLSSVVDRLEAIYREAILAAGRNGDSAPASLFSS